VSVLRACGEDEQEEEGVGGVNNRTLLLHKATHSLNPPEVRTRWHKSGGPSAPYLPAATVHHMGTRERTQIKWQRNVTIVTVVSQERA
jgi:hypothetical protein